MQTDLLSHHRSFAASAAGRWIHNRPARRPIWLVRQLYGSILPRL